MPARLNLNGELLPIGTSDLNGDTSEEEDIGPSEPPQWSDAEWEAYQASLQDYNEGWSTATSRTTAPWWARSSGH